MNLSGAINATIADTQGVGTIVNDDTAPSTCHQRRHPHGGERAGRRPLTFTVTLSAPSGRTVTVTYATANGTATDPATTPRHERHAHVPAGYTTMTFNVPVVGDLLNEVDETFVVNLTTPGTRRSPTRQGVGTIPNDDPVPDPIHQRRVSLTEGNTGTTGLTFTVSLSAASGKTVTVGCRHGADRRWPPSDYTRTYGHASRSRRDRRPGPSRSTCTGT